MKSVLNFSGGKDSTAMLFEIIFKEINPKEVPDASSCSLSGDCKGLFGIKPKIVKLCGGQIELPG